MVPEDGIEPSLPQGKGDFESIQVLKVPLSHAFENRVFST